MDQTTQHPDTASDLGEFIGERQLDVPEVERCADRLEIISERMLSFLHSQIDTLHGVANDIDAAIQRVAEYEAKSLELEQRQANWEQQKELEAKRMSDDARLLSEAWDRIEEQRRNYLTAGSELDTSNIDPPVNSDCESEGREKAPPTLTETDLFDLGVPALMQTPSVQFQQMKREIRQHARRNR